MHFTSFDSCKVGWEINSRTGNLMLKPYNLCVISIYQRLVFLEKLYSCGVCTDVWFLMLNMHCRLGHLAKLRACSLGRKRNVPLVEKQHIHWRGLGSNCQLNHSFCTYLFREISPLYWLVFFFISSYLPIEAVSSFFFFFFQSMYNCSFNIF